MEQIWTFIRTLCRGVLQGIDQYITNDLPSYVPFLVVSGIILVVTLLLRIIRKIKSK